ncbi:fungal-specific transcription factor domain-containing protein [Aspergillus aurantiobrunneus]
MFSTFVAVSSDRSDSSNHASASSPAPRSKRSQVARACDWCRVHRIKCDSSLPCRNCSNRGGRCIKKSVTKSAPKTQTLPHALRLNSLPLGHLRGGPFADSNGTREIERLQQQVQDLEHRLDKATRAASPRSDQCGTRGGWEGIHTRAARSSQTQWYGPSSTFYFIGRMNAYLSTVLQQPQDDHSVQPNSASRTFSSPTSPKQLPELADGPAGSETYLNSIEEDFFLNMFWHSYHPTYQILDEADFREHYKSLWVDSATTRASSALVDIILALCMQYGVATTSSSCVDGHIDIKDASIAGRWYYRRSQTLLTLKLESPSITTLQCHIFSVVYLCNASFQNMAHTTLALAVRTAHILGLHLEPPTSLPRPQRELRKRIWWTLYTIETKTCMKLGRPCSVSEASATCQLPADDHELARLSVSNIAAYGDRVTWFTYGRLLITLVLAVQTVYDTYYEKCAEILAANNAKNLYADASSLEASAEFLIPQLDMVWEWLRTVPDAMKTKRSEGGEAFSTDPSRVVLERYAPSWLQHQRLLLELLYHNLLMNIYRPFICFPSASGNSFNATPVAEGHAVSCINHAIAITNILGQIVVTTDFLKGWYEAFQWQWNSTLSMVGFMLAYPLHPSTPAARSAIDSAVTVFEVFGKHFAVAASAADVTRELIAKTDFLSGLVGAGVDPATSLTPAFTDQMDGLLGHLGTGTVANSMLASDPTAMFQGTLAGAMGLAYNVDSFYSFEPLYAAGPWNFSQE